MKKDGHIHTPFCPHGSTDSFEQYIEKAIEQNFASISFTEHAPLPAGFIDPTPDQDSGMKAALLQPYLQELRTLKELYQDKITIHIGLEVDYISGFELETRHFLNEVGPFLDDAILSVHFLKHDDAYCCIDFSEEVYLNFAKQIGSIRSMYDLYYKTVRKSIDADLGSYKPKRIGHPTLIHKFQLAHQEQIDDAAQIKQLLRYMKVAGYELDVNSAGLSKPLCKEPYPPFPFIDFAKSIELPLVFGSDAHTAQDLHQHYSIIFP
ncbi:histidinol-phosphatase HisJ [Solibacillus sp. FSL H8-0538]|uniref:histidinol-phosphatase HisJ n=1 Tax=Solibacillus sp. FSL H8-0538 TaxID=2921400 RepID=UPI0030F92215